jgi:transcriptional regulator with XRE-family HTH domain
MRNPPAQREIEIGKRLRAFRESLNIPRTSFALEIGVSSERQATYEAGRVPLRWETFLAISKRYFLNPVWLAIGQGEPSMAVAFEDSQFHSLVRPRMLFSQAIDGIMKEAGPPGLLILHHKIVELGRIMGEIVSVLPNVGASPDVFSAIESMNSAFSNLLQATHAEYQRNQTRRDVVKKAILKSPPKKS